MTTFTTAEIDYLSSQRLGRLATTSPDGSPHVVPVGFRLHEDGAIDIGGHGLSDSQKWRNLVDDPRAAFVIDDLASTDPWRPRGIQVRGRAELHDDGGGRMGPGFGDAWLRIRPERVVAWGLDTGAFGQTNSRDIDRT